MVRPRAWAVLRLSASKASARWVSGSSRAKTYGKAQCQGETFPITRLFGKGCARSNRHVKDLNRVAPGEPCIVFGKVSDNTAVSV
jgi:hypothetical protein